MPSTIINVDANDVSRRTRDVRKVRIPKNAVASKLPKYAESALWKHRKGKAIQKCRDAKYTEDTEVRGEEAEVHSILEDHNNEISNGVSRPFTIYKDVPESYSYRIFPSGAVRYVTPAKRIVVLCGTHHSTADGNIDNDVVVVNYRINKYGALERFRRHYHAPMYCMFAELFDLCRHGPGSYKMEYWGDL